MGSVVPPKGKTVLGYDCRADADQLAGIRKRVLKAALNCGCSADVADEIVIAVDEACQNIIRHGYGGDCRPDCRIELEICCRDDEIIVLLRDFANPVDVDTIKPRDLSEVRPGGLGVSFMKQVMDEVSFLAPEEGRGNLLRMVRKIA